jgi:uncharacterized protein involved in outer membrane biogenesis
MSLTSKKKIWLVIICIPVVLIAGAAISLKLYFTGDRLKSLVVPRLEEATGRTVSLQSISLSVFPSLAVEIDSLTVSNRREKGFSHKPFVSLDKLVLDVRLTPLLKGLVEVPTIRLERPTFLLEINKDGIRNYRMEKPQEIHTDTGTVVRSTKTEGGGVLFSNFEIVNGTVNYIDWQENSATTVEGLNHRMRIEMVPIANQVRMEGRTTIERLSYGTTTSPTSLISNLHATLDLALLFEQEKDMLIFQRGDGMLQDIPLTVSGTISNLTKIPELNIVVGSDRVTIPQLLSLAPKEYLKKAEDLQGTGSAQFKINITGLVTDTTKPDLAGVITASNATIRYSQLPKPITNITVVADFARTKTKQQFRLTKFSALLGNNPLAATLNVTNFEDPVLTTTIDGSMNLAEVKDYYPLEAGTELAGNLKANVNISGKVSNPSEMKAAGKMEFQNVTAKTAGTNKPIQNLNGAIAFNNQIVEAKKLSMNVGKSDMTLAFWLKNYLSLMADTESAPKPVANLTLTSNRLYTADVTSDAPVPPAQGKHGATPQPTQGATKAVQRSGLPLPNVEMDIAATIGTLVMEKLELSNVRSTMKVAHGIVTLQNFSCNTFEGSVITRGTLNLQKPDRPTVDMVMDIHGVNANSMLSKFTSFGKLLHGKLTMNTTLKGALDDTLGLVAQSLNGQGNVMVENGQLTGMKVNSAVAGLLKLPDLETINFKDWTNAFSVSDGRVNVKDLKITALGADYVVNGSQGLDGSLDYRMSLVLSDNTSAKVTIPGFAGEAVKLFKDERGRVKLDLTVGGNTDNPSVALDTRVAQQRVESAAKQKVTDEAKKVQEQLKQKGQDLLKDLFKKKK